ncbi:MAG: glycosyltransferase [Sphingobacteriaceae bacterium]|nr:glycosyltransferase [Sphingobacteriaceae bacterium]
MNVGVLIIEMANLSGSGGAERFYADFFESYNNQSDRKRDFYFISDDLSELHRIGKLKLFTEKQLAFQSYRKSFFYEFTRNRPRIDKKINYLRIFLTKRSLLKQLEQHEIKALVLPVYEDKDFGLIKSLDNLPKNKRPKIILNVTNAVVQNHYFDTNPRYAYHSKLNYGRLFEQVKLDGIYTWYKAFKEFVENKKVLNSNPLVHSVSSRFTATDFFEDFSERENRIIFSGRLSEYKDPLLFIKAAQIVNKRMPDSNWKFEMYGKGPLENEVRIYLKSNDLESVVLLSHTPDMQKVLRKSRIYVSTQNAENFPSLAMAEAMACCNLIIARNVGQTDFYVKDTVNGFLLKTGDPEELADMLIKVMQSPEIIETMGKESVSLLKNIHNKENFIKEIDDFWDELEKTIDE